MQRFIIKEKLAKLRKRWLDYKKRGDELMASLIERQAKVLKIELKKLRDKH